MKVNMVPAILCGVVLGFAIALLIPGESGAQNIGSGLLAMAVGFAFWAIDKDGGW